MPRIKKTPLDQGENLKELELTCTLRNNRLKRRRLALGLSQRDFARKLKVPVSVYATYERLARSPCTVRGEKIEWSPMAWKIANHFYVEPEDLWPDVVLKVKHPKVTREIDGTFFPLLTDAQRSDLKTPEDHLLEAEAGTLHDRVDKALSTLSEREADVLRKRFGFVDGIPRTLRDVGESLGVQRTRISQIEHKAIRKLNHPSRRRVLESAASVPEPLDEVVRLTRWMRKREFIHTGDNVHLVVDWFYHNNVETPSSPMGMIRTLRRHGRDDLVPFVDLVWEEFRLKGEEASDGDA